MDRRDIFTFERGEYTPYYVYIQPSRTPEEISREYSRLRSIAIKRINRLKEAGFYGPEQVATIKSYLPKVAEARASTKKAALGHALVYAASYLLAGTTVTEARNRLAKINARYGKELQPAELETFDNFMMAWRLYAKNYIDSGRAASDYDAYVESASESATEFWLAYNSYKRNGGMYE